MNRSHATDAIVLRTHPVGENHRGVVMLSRTDGLIRAIAHGANSSRGRLRGSTVVFASGRVFLYTNPRNQSTKITDMEAREFFTGVRSDLKKFYTASLWAELVLKTFASGGSAELHDLMYSALNVLDRIEGPRVDLVSIQFLWRFLKLAGSQPDLDTCACCGEFLAPEEAVSYVVAESGFCSVSHGCASPEESGDVIWTPGARAYLRHSASQALPESVNIAPPADAILALKRLLHFILQELVETPLNTLRTGAGVI